MQYLVEETECAMEYDYGDAHVVSVDWKEGPVALYKIAALIVEHVRPMTMPAIPEMSFGDDPETFITALIDEINMGPAYDPNWKVTSLETGSDQYIFLFSK